uniref:Uncharacterized protein n=1 Tax=Triticum urartu TaxID=4572 RepID=A0A8R7U705_TRIUA
MPCLTFMAARDDRYNPSISNERAGTVKVDFLVTMNPNEFQGNNMMSTVTIMRLASEHW